MYSRNSFGSFYPVDSAVHRLNPVIKLFNFVIVLIILIITKSLYIHLFILALLLIMMILSYVPFRYYMKTFWSLRYIYILMAFIFAYFNFSLQDTLVYIMKLVIFVEYLNILSYTTSPSESAYGIEKFLSLFNFLMLPVSKLAFKINSIIRYIPLMLVVENKTLKASASRGIDYNHSNVIVRTNVLFKLYSNIKRLTRYRNKEIEQMSNLKLYNVKTYRTNYRVNKVGFYDIFFTAFHLLLLYIYIEEAGLL